MYLGRKSTFSYVFQIFLYFQKRSIYYAFIPIATYKNRGGHWYSCMPPSIRFAERWSKLDTNEDGVWTMAEAMAAGWDSFIPKQEQPAEPSAPPPPSESAVAIDVSDGTATAAGAQANFAQEVSGVLIGGR